MSVKNRTLHVKDITKKNNRIVSEKEETKQKWKISTNQHFYEKNRKQFLKGSLLRCCFIKNMNNGRIIYRKIFLTFPS